jgi:hypothetical protein
LYREDDKKTEERSLLCTSALTELYLEIAKRLGKPHHAPQTLPELRNLKKQVATDYERVKEQLFTQHPVLKLWRRRYD